MVESGSLKVARLVHRGETWGASTRDEVVARGLEYEGGDKGDDGRMALVVVVIGLIAYWGSPAEAAPYLCVARVNVRISAWQWVHGTCQCRHRGTVMTVGRGRAARAGGGQGMVVSVPDNWTRLA